jgi:hypothetical protein
MKYLRLAGRCRNGYERDGGTRVHAITDKWKSLCGAKPGPKSQGWSSWEEEAATCPRCIDKLKKKGN